MAARLEDLFGDVSQSARLVRVDPDYQAGLDEGVSEIRILLNRLGTSSEPPVARACRRAEGALLDFHRLALLPGPGEDEIEGAESEVRRSFRRIRTAIQRLSARRTGETDRLADRAARFTMIATAVGSLVAIGLWISLVTALGRPLRDLVAGTERISEGRFDEQIPVRAGDELGRLAEAFNRMSEALGDLEKMKAEFLAAASHGLRTPLACAKGHLASLEAGRQGGLTEESLRTVARIEGELDRVSRFVDQLLDLGRLRAGRLSMSMRGVPAAAFFTSVGKSFEPLAEKKHIRYKISVEERLPGRITADPDRLGEALTNLLDNAFKYTPEGGAVSLSVKGQDGRVRVEVADTGPGIPAGEVGRIFERYYRGGGVTAQGTGLGLAIARGIVERHGGAIWAEGKEEAGARFVFEVPAERAVS
jgi:signal transduction histidine kinase